MKRKDNDVLDRIIRNVIDFTSDDWVYNVYDEFIKNDILRLTERNTLLDHQLEFFRSISLRSTSEIIMLPTSEFKNGFNTKINIIIDLNNYIIKILNEQLRKRVPD